MKQFSTHPTLYRINSIKGFSERAQHFRFICFHQTSFYSMAQRVNETLKVINEKRDEGRLWVGWFGWFDGVAIGGIDFLVVLFRADGDNVQ